MRQVHIALIILMSVSVCRWDIGNDYANYARHAIELAKEVNMHGGVLGTYQYNEGRAEITYIFLSWLFGTFPGNYVWTIGTYAIITQMFIFLSLKRVNGYFWGFFALFITEFLFFSWDIVRQSAAITVILFAVEYIKQGHPMKWILCVIIAALFHTSAIILFPVYFLRWIKVCDFVLVSLIIVVTILMWLGILTGVMSEITAYFALFEYYEGYADNVSTLNVAESTFYKLRLVLYACFWSGIIILLPQKEKLYKIMITIGSCIFLFAMNSLTLLRISWYFLIVILVALPLVFQSKKMKGIRRAIFSGILGAMVLMFSIDIVRNSNVRGCVPFDSIFSETYSMQKFRPKAY